MKLLIFGDSIAVGQYVSPHRTWAHLVSTWLDCDVANESRSGDTTRCALQRIGTAQDFGADVAIVQFGINDCNQWASDKGLSRVSLDSFAANLAEIEARLRHFGVSRFLYATNHPTTKPGTERLPEYNAKIRGLSAECIDHERSWIDGLLLDGVHPNADGHERIARAVMEAL